MPKENNKLDYELPPIQCAAVAILIVIAAVAWLFCLLGVTWERWPPLKLLCTIPLLILLLVFLPSLIRKIRERTEWRE